MAQFNFKMKIMGINKTVDRRYQVPYTNSTVTNNLVTLDQLNT